MAFSKVILNNTTLMDVTADTVAADNLGEDYTAHNAAGNSVTGIADIVTVVNAIPSEKETSIIRLDDTTNYYAWKVNGVAPSGGGDTSDATATQDEICLNKTAYIATGKVTGTGDMVHTVSSLPSTQDTSIVKLSTNEKYYSWRSGSAPTPVTTTATVADVLSGKTAIVGGVYSTGTMPDNGAVTITLEGGQVYTIPLGYHNGYGTITAPMGGSSLDKNQAITPYQYDFLPGYVDNTTSKWTYQNSTNNSTDVYNNIVAGHWYIILLGDVVGTRFRALNVATDPTSISSGTISGFSFGMTNNPSAFSYYISQAQYSGYIAVTKDNASTRNLKSYLFDLTDLCTTGWQSQF